MADGMVLSGFEGLDRKLLSLERKVAKKIVRKATRESAKVVLKQVKANAKSMIGGNMGALIAKNAKVIVFKFQRKGSYGVQIGMKPNVPQFDYWPIGSSSNLANRKSKGRKSYIPAAIEWGHGNARPIPYIRAAWASTKVRAVKKMASELRQGIEKEALRG
jgi:HK97 gp10 family phage protein